MADDDEQIKIEVLLADLTSPAAENIDRKIENIDDSSKSASESVESLGDESATTDKKLADMGKSAKGASKGVKAQGDETEKAAGSTRKLGNEIDLMNKKGKKTSQTVSGLKKVLGIINKFKGLILGIGKIGFIADGITFLATAIKGLGAAAYAGVAGLAPLSGMIIAFPAGIAAMIQGIGTLKMATAGMGGAIKAMLDPAITAEAYAAAVKDMSENQIEFARAVADSNDEFKAMKKMVGSKFFKGLAEPFRVLSKNYIPLLNYHLGKNAEIWNSLLGQAMAYLNTAKGMDEINDIMDTNNKLFYDFGRAGGSGMLMMMDLLRSAGPMLRLMSGEFADMMSRGAEWTDTHQKQLGKFFDNSYELFKATSDVLGDYMTGLFNIGKYSKSLSKMMGHDLADIGKQFRDWTESMEGKSEIKQFFKDMRPIVRELGRWIRDISKALSDITMADDDFMDISKGLRKKGLPAIVDLFQAFTGKMLPALVKVLDTYESLKKSGALGGLSRAVGIVASAISILARALEKMPDAAKNALGMLTTLYGLKKIGGMALGGTALGSKLGMTGKIQKVFVTNWAMMGGVGKGGVAAAGGGKKAPLLVGGGAGTAVAGKTSKVAKITSKIKGGLKPRAAGLSIPTMLAAATGTTMMGSENSATNVAGGAVTGAAVARMAGKSVVKGGVVGIFAGLIASSLKDAKTNNANMAAAVTGEGGLDQMIGEYANQQKLAEMNKHTIPLTYEEQAATNFTKEYADPPQVIVAEQIAAKFEELTNMTIPQFQKSLEGLPTDIQTMIKTPGLETTNRDVQKLLARYDMTPKEKKTTLSLLGVDPALLKLRDIKAAIDQIRDKNVQINIQRTETLIQSNKGGIGKGEAAFGPPLFKGGITGANTTHLTGEMGPEAWISRSGAIKMLGLNGPEFASPGAGAVIPASATADPWGGNTGEAPGWAVDALRKVSVGSTHTSPSKSGGGSAAGPMQVQIGPIYPQNEMDIESAVRTAFARIRAEEDERR